MDSFSGGGRMSVCSVTSGGEATVPVVGEVDYLTSPRLGQELEAAVASGVRSVEVDLRQVSFCDCSALNVLVGVRAQACREGVSFGVVGPVAPVVERLFQVTGVGGILPVRAAA